MRDTRLLLVTDKETREPMLINMNQVLYIRQEIEQGLPIATFVFEKRVIRARGRIEDVIKPARWFP